MEKLGGIFTKPKLSEKLLSKPPFRFIHDCISNVTKETGFLEGLFEGDELNAKAMKDKSAKISYLEKAIAAVNFAMGSTVDVRANKVVAGMEPENTNMFLAALGECAKDKSKDWAGAVASVKGGGGEAGGGDDAKEATAEKKTFEEEEKPSKKEAPAPAPAKENPPAATAPAGPDLTADIAECNGDWARTKEVVSAIIAKPKMSEKLLSKPPFRFIHDVFTEITKATNFAAGLYEGPELDAKGMKDKGAKISFLEKMIKCVGFQLGITVDARPAKIVAGLEAEHTNTLFQLLALCATKKPDSSVAVNCVLTGTDMPAAAPAAAPAPAKEPAPAKAVPAPLNTPTHAVKGDATHFDEAAKKKDQEGPFLSRQQTMDKDDLPEEADAKDAKDAPDEKGMDDEAPSELPSGGVSLGMVSGGQAKGEGEEGGPALGGPIKRSMRPTTAKRRPPRVKDKLKETEGPGANVVTDAKGAAPSVVGLMVEGQEDKDSDDEEENKEDATLGMQLDPRFAAGGQHGKLVQDIMNDQAKEEEKKKEEEEQDQKAGGGIRMGRIKKKTKQQSRGGGYSDGEVERLRHSIQLLCQSTNPLGKCMDYVTEDLTMMNTELERWSADYRRKTEVLEEEQKETEDSLQPLRLQLLEVTEQIKEQIQKINGVKSNIAKNDDRIKQLLRMISTSVVG
eukprot:CAMPEP_0117792410 /NCGR_PEP_ID=MMETSP0948-20121206/9421_1 /TAXON_ID=44440 /ORGANISM="Chattonella subsalsa, Strain CCMP2191" /LENGTH=677 /DNA_ID=CAMNT_0005622619 /DNA_START=115 /DNA_END=2148 /DNA_ORIENTATION=+